ncbi:hypothetical protein C9J21_11645 [Photobacterium phosphoreum]|nr:hypothetical protein C9J21_11645 [Photobacterium phosphoreum]
MSIANAYHACRYLSQFDDGWPLTPNRIIMGNALIEVGAADELRFQREVLRMARILKRLK